MRLKIDLYRRLARVTSLAELEDFRTELDDRFGPPPPAMRRLLALAELRIAAHRWRLSSIRLEDHYVVFGYTSGRLIRQLSEAAERGLRIVDERTAYLPLEEGFTHSEQIFGRIKSLLQSG
jgi:transcription-repair coupling factor (superfamily II helicase)